jgi:hypothetical protein
MDPKDPQKRPLIYLLVPVMLLTCALQIYFGTEEKERADSDGEELADAVAKTRQGKLDISKLPNVQQSSQADAELKTTIRPPSQRQGVVTIEYFPKDVDREKWKRP